MEILTTKGMLEEGTLDKREIFENRDDEWVIAVEWRLRDETKELVKRDCHVIKKRPAEASVATAGGF